jgi:DNA repair protein RadC
MSNAIANKLPPSVVRLAFKRETLESPPTAKYESPADAAGMLVERYGDLPQEVFAVLHFAGDGTLLSIHEIAMGGRDRCEVDARVLFAGALLADADALVLTHNHPTGDPTPSDQDLTMTARLVKMAEQLGLHIADHIITAPGGRYSSMMSDAIERLGESTIRVAARKGGR